MRAVLGIDAAWTLAQPSGVALAVESKGGWHLTATASSYQRFFALADPCQLAEEPPSGSPPDAVALLAAASALCGRAVDLVAIDMPLAHSAIVGRRLSDDAVSRAYGTRKCGTHTPSAARPGRISDDLRQGFEDVGYPLRTDSWSAPGIIEVYPHPALVELAGAAQRLPYKASKVRRYWPSATSLERRALLYQQWSAIVAMLDGEIAGVKSSMPALEISASGLEIKAYEDQLDAIVCAWVATRVLGGAAKSYGDKDSAIWIPLPARHRDKPNSLCLSGKSLVTGGRSPSAPSPW
jgi:predicted RNase H-like nuclease